MGFRVRNAAKQRTHGDSLITPSKSSASSAPTEFGRKILQRLPQLRIYMHRNVGEPDMGLIGLTYPDSSEARTKAVPWRGRSCERNVHQDSLVQRLAQYSANESVPIGAMGFAEMNTIEARQRFAWVLSCRSHSPAVSQPALDTAHSSCW